jgi:hypothetical protein
MQTLRPFHLLNPAVKSEMTKHSIMARFVKTLLRLQFLITAVKSKMMRNPKRRLTSQRIESRKAATTRHSEILSVILSHKAHQQFPRIFRPLLLRHHSLQRPHRAREIDLTLQPYESVEKRNHGEEEYGGEKTKSKEERVRTRDLEYGL